MAQLQLLEYQDAWPDQFLQVAAELLAAFSDASAAIEHIGSTAVPGLCAKPVLDVLVGVEVLDQAVERLQPLAVLGYRYRPEYETQLPQRRYFVRRQGRTLRVHLHCVVHQSRLWQQHVLFRDRLLQHQQTRLAYAALKRNLAKLHADDKDAYTEAKAPFIRRVLAEAASSA